uniref:Ovule protein n=1 Tax=Anisakis simplex TaxID=6269 RepID=A0A0M3JLM0_ANISI
LHLHRIPSQAQFHPIQLRSHKLQPQQHRLQLLLLKRQLQPRRIQTIHDVHRSNHNKQRLKQRSHVR